jgi:hypothetical protein
MSNLKATNKSNPCPVCGTTSNKCREQTDGDQELWHCHTHSDASKGDRIAGSDGRRYICLAPMRCHTAMFAVDSGVWSAEEKEDYQRRQLERRVESDRRRAEMLAREMPAGDRDKYFGKLISELALSPEDRQNLLDRGFTDSQIEEVGFRSIAAQQPLTGNYPHNLPGYQFGFGAGKLQNSGAGILCPIPDWQGNIVGAQIRLSKVGEGEGRYRWLSSRNNPAHLNGENPIACWDKAKDKAQDKIWLAEGTGIKPALASLRLGASVVGAAGGLFASSPKNTEVALAHLSQKYGTRSLVLAADAGDVVNPQVMNRWRIQVKFLEKLNYTVAFAWWEQVSKEAEDIDELASFEGIRYITPNEFWAIANEQQEIAEACKGDRDRPKLRSDRREEARSEEVRSREPLPLQPRPLQWGSWLKLRAYTPDISQDSQYVRFDAPAPGTIFAVRSGLGSGKTYQLQSLFAEGGAFEGKGAVALFARNSLVFNFVDRIPSFSHLNEELSLLVKDPASRLALCTNSLKKFSNPEYFDGKILIIDEFSSVATHIACSSTHRKDRIDSLELWREAFVRCESVIILDGNLTDWQVEWAGKQAPSKKIVKLQNTCHRAKAKVEILLGTPTKSGKFDDTKLSPFIAPMMGANQPFIVFSDSQKLLEQIEELLAPTGKLGLRIDSKTIRPNSEERAFLNNCNKWIEEHKPDYILLSPTAESGVDISVPGYFPHSYGLFRGIVATDSQMQMMARYRCPDCYWHISVPKQSFLRGSDRDYNLENINAAAAKLMELSEMDISHLRLNKGWLGEQFLKYIEEAHNNINVSFALKNRAKESFEKDNLRECLIFALEDAGHDVSQSAYYADARVEGMLKIAGEEVKDRTAKQIFEAADISEKEAEDIAASWSAVWEDRVKVIKAGYKKLLPGIEDTEFWTQDFIRYLKYDNPKAIAGANLLYQFQHPEVANKKQQNTWAKIATERAIFLPDIHSPHLKIKALQFLKLEQFLECDRNWHKNSPEILELVRVGNRPRIIASIGFGVPRITKGKRKGEVDAMRYLGKLLELVGMKLGPCQRVRESGQQTNQYALDREWVENPMRVAIASAVERRYEEFDREWVLPEVLQVQVQEVSSQESVVSEPEPSEPEPETDEDGVDWRGAAMELKEAFGGLLAGARVDLEGQPREVGEKIMVWARSAIGRIQLELGLLSLYFE